VSLLEDCPKLLYLKLDLKRQKVEKHWSNGTATARAKYESMVVKEKIVYDSDDDDDVMWNI
jgi:hypothetical protein